MHARLLVEDKQKISEQHSETVLAVWNSEPAEVKTVSVGPMQERRFY